MKKRFKCPFCDNRYIHEARFMKHRCKPMIRDEEFKSVLGQQAWTCYESWMFSMKRFKPAPDTFLVSSQYAYFMKFVKYARRVQMADVNAFIKIMIAEGNIPPSMWTLPEAHTLYLNKLDRLITPLQMVSISVDTLFDLSEEYGVPIGKLFGVISPNEVILLIQRRKLSPWLLLKSPKFAKFYKNHVSAEERIILTTIIKHEFWHKKFSKHQTEVDQIKGIVVELNL